MVVSWVRRRMNFVRSFFPLFPLSVQVVNLNRSCFHFPVVNRWWTVCVLGWWREKNVWLGWGFDGVSESKEGWFHDVNESTTWVCVLGWWKEGFTWMSSGFEERMSANKCFPFFILILLYYFLFIYIFYKAQQ